MASRGAPYDLSLRCRRWRLGDLNIHNRGGPPMSDMLCGGIAVILIYGCALLYILGVLP